MLNQIISGNGNGTTPKPFRSGSEAITRNINWILFCGDILQIVPTQQLSKLSNLSYLSMSGNSFSYLPAVALLNLFHLRELHLDHLDRLIKIDSR